VAEIPAPSLVLGGDAPVYHRSYAEPRYFEKIAAFSLESVPQPTDWARTARQVATAPNVASKRWVYEQYDSMVRTNNLSTNRPSDAAVVRVKESGSALALTVDCNSAYVYADPHVGAMIAVAEAARNIVCTGGKPLAITNCLNFGNPYNPEVYYQFVHAIKGMGEACRKFGTPVTGGNVSFYNQSTIGEEVLPVYPTPTIGMVGLIEDPERAMTLDFKGIGDEIYLLGDARDDLGSSEYLRTVHGVEHSPVPYFDLEEEHALQEVVAELIEQGLVASAHDVSDGGLFVCLLEKAMPRGLGFSVRTDARFRKDAYLFGESQSRVVVTVSADQKAAFLQALADEDLGCTLLGSVEGHHILVDGEDFGPVSDWTNVYDHVLHHLLDR
jgi:phosphoribosylformylglycinamidine synthase